LQRPGGFAFGGGRLWCEEVLLSVERFYDELAPFYHLIFPDWEASIRRQAEALDGVIRERWGIAACPSSMSLAGSAPRHWGWPLWATG
jgi:hypothetical protein